MMNNFTSSPVFIEIIVNLVILIFIIIGCVVFLCKVKLEGKNYKLLFVNYIMFWFSIMLIRDYRGIFQERWDRSLLWLPLMIYGCVGIFIRPFFDFLGIKIRSRKIIIYIALITQFVTFLPIIIVQNQATSVIQALGIGIGASLIGNYDFFFKEQYGKSRSFLTISILAFPPLIADFATNPIQAIIKSYAQLNGGDHYLDRMLILWIIAIAIIPFTFIFIFFIKEDRNFVGISIQDKQESKVNSSERNWFFISLLLIGVIITFVKFSNSGGVGQDQLEKLAKYKNIKLPGSISGYLSAVFTVGQVLGTFIFISLVTKKISKNIVFIIGITTWIIYHFVSLFIFNPYVFFSIHIFNGIAYGIVYNLVMGFVLSLSFKNKYITPMGIYQSVSAIGITAGSWFSPYLKNNVMKSNDIKTAIFTIDSIIILALIIMCLIYGINYYYLVYKKKTKIDQPISEN